MSMSILLPNGPGKAQRATKDFMRRIEMEAMQIRRDAKVGPLEPFEPRILVEKAGLRLARPADVPDLQPEVRDYVCSLEPSIWSGMGKALDDSCILVLLNPNMTVERENVTIMEEVCHVHYGHEPSELVAHPAGFEERKYDESVEQEAYWTAAAVLLPSKVVAMAVWRGETAEDLAAQYNVSPELAEMRIKTLGFWPYYDPNGQTIRRAS